DVHGPDRTQHQPRVRLHAAALRERGCHGQHFIERLPGSDIPDPGHGHGAQAMRARASSYRYTAPHGLRRRRQRLLLGVPAGVIGAALLGVTAALAFFSATSNSGTDSAAALGGAIGTGQTPSGLTVSGRDVTLSWSTATNAL